MESFEYKNVLERSKMELDDLVEYYMMQRKYEYAIGTPIDKGLSFRRTIHPILLNGIKLSRFFDGKTLTIIGDKSYKTDRPIIYTSNHIGRFDVEMVFEAIKKHAYLFIGDPCDLYQKLTGLILYLNGMIALETSDKEDRHISKERAIELLKKGGSLLIYPEGAWNLTENKIIMHLYTGSVEMAIKSGAMIVPVAIEQNGKDFYANIGKNIDFSNKSLEDKRLLTNELRDIMATLRWEIWEQLDVSKRSNIGDDYLEEYVKNIMDESEFIYTAEDAYKTYYKPKDIVEYDEAFAFMKKLKPNKNNAFLLKK